MALTGLTDQDVAQVLADPQRLRLLSSPLGRYMTMAEGGNSAIVTRFPDVVDVLENEDSFHVAEIYAEAMARTIGVFVLGMDDRARHAREVRFLRSAVSRDDLARIYAIVGDEAETLIEAATTSGRLDIADGYAHRIALAVVAKYFGITGPDPETMGLWMRSIAWDIFFNVNHRADVTTRAVASARQLNAYLDAKIRLLQTAFRKTKEVPDHFLGRLVMNQPQHDIDDDGIRRNIAGLIVGSVDTISKSIVHAVDQLLRWPTPLALACKAAQADQDETVRAYAFEALRFNPNNPIIIRHCAKDFVLAAGTNREAFIASGSKVYANTLSAMFDESVLAAPNEFRVDRPWEHYLHFGRGIHSCFGEHFSRVSVAQAVKALLLRPNLRPAPGFEGRIHYEGPFPRHLLVKIGSKE